MFNDNYQHIPELVQLAEQSFINIEHLSLSSIRQYNDFMGGLIPKCTQIANLETQKLRAQNTQYTPNGAATYQNVTPLKLTDVCSSEALKELIVDSGSNADKFKTYLILTKVLGLQPTSYQIFQDQLRN